MKCDSINSGKPQGKEFCKLRDEKQASMSMGLIDSSFGLKGKCEASYNFAPKEMQNIGNKKNDCEVLSIHKYTISFPFLP